MNVYECHLNLRKKKISSVELVRDCLEKFKKAENNSFISLTSESALKQAGKMDKEMAESGLNGPLHGIPYSLKDLFITKGLRTTAGSRILYNYIPPYDGYVSERLKSAGAVLMGKTALDEFGMGSMGKMTPFPVVTNPLDKKRAAGGSSSGSAASVCEGSSLFSVGTDTGGSVRLPAVFCGLVGFKPTYGRVSRYGQIAYASSLDQASPIAKTVVDIACIMEEITQKDFRDATQACLPPLNMENVLKKGTSGFLKGKKMGISSPLIENCREDMRLSLEGALRNFKAEGVELVEIDFPHFQYAVPTYYIISSCEASANLARYDGIHYGLRTRQMGDIEQTYIKSRSIGFGEEVKRRILLGTFALSSGFYEAYYNKACLIRRLITKDFEDNFKKCDIVFLPVSSGTAFPLDRPQSVVETYLNDLYTIPVNLAGLPGLSIPFLTGKDGLPTGFQLTGPAFADEEVLKTGIAFERELS